MLEHQRWANITKRISFNKTPEIHPVIPISWSKAKWWSGTSSTHMWCISEPSLLDVHSGKVHMVIMPIKVHPMADTTTDNHKIQAVRATNHNKIHPWMVAPTGLLPHQEPVCWTTLSIMPRSNGDSTAFLTMHTHWLTENMERITWGPSETCHPPQ